MKKFLVKISVLLFLFSLTAETGIGLWSNPGLSVVIMEKEGKGKTDESKTEKEESKDKMVHCLSDDENKNCNRSKPVLSHIYFKYSAYLSLPEMPPEMA